MQQIRLTEETDILTIKLEQYPQLVVDSARMEANSARNRFIIRNQKTGAYVIERPLRANDFLTSQFDDRLRRLAQDGTL